MDVAIFVLLLGFWWVLLLINDKLRDIRDYLSDIRKKLRGTNNE